MRQLMAKDTPCEAGLKFIDEEGIIDLELADCWDIIKEKRPLFLGWGVKHMPMGPDKIKALRLVKDSGALEDEELNNSPEVALRCFGWIENPFKAVETWEA